MWAVLANERPVGAMIQVTKTAQMDDNLLAMNEALVLGSLRQHELTETAESLNIQLQKEIVERKLAEALLSCQKQALEMVAKGEPLKAVLDFLARSMERQSQDEFLVALHLLEEDGHHFGQVAAPSLPSSYAQATKGMDARLQMGPCSAAVVAQTPTVVRDFATEVRWPAFTADIISLGFRGCFTTPIVSSNQKILGTFAIYYREPRDPSPSDQQLVEVVTHTASIAIERKQAEKMLRESEERFRALFELGPVAVYSCDASGVIREFNRRAVELWDRAPALGDTDERFCGSFKLFGPDGSFMPHEQCPMAEVISGKIPAARDAEMLIERPDGSRVTVIVNVRPLKNERGEITGAINCFYDITERKEAEQRQHFLMKELVHRGKNLLAVIQSIASRSLSGTRSLTEASEVLIRRLHALARSQSALITGGFEGAPVAEIIRLEFEGFSDRVKTVGSDVMLNPRVAQTFALLLHELATNATKYGALSLPDGQVAIHWSIEGAGADARFKFQWQERDGPPVVPPTRQGFGCIVLEKAAAQDFGAPPKIRFAPEGLSYEIDAPLSVVAAASAGGAAALERSAGTNHVDNVLSMD